MGPLDSHERERLAGMLANPFSLGTILYAIALRHLGDELHSMEPETVFMELEDEIGPMHPLNHDKLMALLSAITTNQFYHNWIAFVMISHFLSGDDDPTDLSDPLLVAEAAWACKEIALSDSEPHPFAIDVAVAVGNLLQEDGFVSPPPELRFAKMPVRHEELSSPGDVGKDQTLSTEHAAVVAEYIQDQSATLFRQISALPWHTEETLANLVLKLKQ